MNILIVVAHPDDEAFLFGGRMLELDHKYDVLVFTKGNWHNNELQRLNALFKSSKLFNFKVIKLESFDDNFNQHLSFNKLFNLLKDFRGYDQVWTHSPYGDYHNHKHHSDVAYACSRTFGLNVRYFGLKHVYTDGWKMSRTTYNEKIKLLEKIYFKEYLKFSKIFQNYIFEEMCYLDPGEVSMLYLLIYGSEVYKYVNFDELHSYINIKDNLIKFRRIYNLISKLKIENTLIIGLCPDNFIYKLNNISLVFDKHKYYNNLKIDAVNIYNKISCFNESFDLLILNDINELNNDDLSRIFRINSENILIISKVSQKIVDMLKKYKEKGYQLIDTLSIKSKSIFENNYVFVCEPEAVFLLKH